jgi:acyl carrier protein
MTNLEKYTKAFAESFEVAPAAVPALAYQSIPAWDSIGHMGLMARLEETFGILLETDDIIDFGSFAKGREILGRYDVAI